MTYLECAWIGDKTQKLQRGKPVQRRVGSGVQSSGSQFMGDGTSSGIAKDDNKVRSLIESVSGLEPKLMFEL